ncbi:Aspartate racemase [Bertholletia excelsa]
MFDGGMRMSMQPHTLNCPPMFIGNINKNYAHNRKRFNPSIAVHFSSPLQQSDESPQLPEPKNSSFLGTTSTGCQASNPLLSQSNTVGILGGVSVFSTLIFLEKLVWGSSRHGQESIPFVVCSDPVIRRELSIVPPVNGKNEQFHINYEAVAENLRSKRKFLEHSGANCVVMPCHMLHAWFDQVSEGCSVPFLNAGDCVAGELKRANLKPIEAGSGIKIGLLTDAAAVAGFYQEKLQNQGFEVVLPDKATVDHIVVPAMEALRRRDAEGARNLVRIAIHILLVRAVNYVILASDEFNGILPQDDPLLKKCIDPVDALARSALKWAKSVEKLYDCSK